MGDRQSWLILALLSFSAGLIFFALQYGFLVVHWPTTDASVKGQFLDQIDSYKKITYYFLTERGWREQQERLLWQSNNDPENLKVLLNNWVGFLQDEGFLKRRCTLETVAFTEHGDHVYLVWDHPLLDQEWSIMQKWRLIESLCKTIKMACSTLQQVSFIVDEQLMSDAHLDFSVPWSLDGFADFNGV